jgi:hypothetical protein
MICRGYRLILIGFDMLLQRAAARSMNAVDRGD